MADAQKATRTIPVPIGTLKDIDISSIRADFTFDGAQYSLTGVQYWVVEGEATSDTFVQHKGSTETADIKDAAVAKALSALKDALLKQYVTAKAITATLNPAVTPPVKPKDKTPVTP